MTEILDLDWQVQEKIPTFITGNDADKMFYLLPEQVRVGLKYEKYSKSLIGSTPFAVANLDVEAQKYGARTPNLRDLSRQELMRIAQGKYSIDSRNLVARSHKDSYCPKNNSLLKTIYELVEEKEGSIKYSFMIEGFSFVPNSKDKTGYGLKLVARPDFKVIQDERFDGKYDEYSFLKVDELGIPNFDKRGHRTWYVKKEGLSRIHLSKDLDIHSNNYSDLADSLDNGRIILLK